MVLRMHADSDEAPAARPTNSPCQFTTMSCPSAQLHVQQADQTASLRMRATHLRGLFQNRLRITSSCRTFRWHSRLPLTACEDEAC